MSVSSARVERHVRRPVEGSDRRLGQVRATDRVAKIHTAFRGVPRHGSGGEVALVDFDPRGPPPKESPASGPFRGHSLDGPPVCRRFSISGIS